MDNGEKIVAAGRKKEEGNALFKAGNYARASKRYEKAAKFIEYDSHFSEDEKREAKTLKVSCSLNNAACKLKLKGYKEAEKLCTKVLEIESRNVKALYRRAQAYINLVDFDLAELDIKKALEIDPNNRDVKMEYKVLKEKVKEYNKKDAKFFRNIFAKMSKLDLLDKPQCEKKMSNKPQCDYNSCFRPTTCFAGNNDDQMLNSVISPYFTRTNHNASYLPPSWLQEQNRSVSRNNFFRESELSNNQLLGSFSPLSSIEIPSPLNYPTAMYGDDIGTSANVEGSIKRMKTAQNRGKQPMAEENMLLGMEEANEERQQLEVLQVENQIQPKRSQKLGDHKKTLRKLVSSCGKNDTASVLSDTADHIKMLHSQIEKLTNPYFRSDHYNNHDQQVTGEMRSSLAERGLCLVPVSFTQNISKEEKR